MKRILCLLLTALMLFPLLAACSPDKESDQLDIVKDGESEYVIIYPEKDAAAKDAASVLGTALRELTGLIPEIYGDSTEESEAEILIGATNRAASQTAMEALKNKKDTFAVAIHDKKLTLVATEGLLNTAAELFYAGIGHLLGGSVGDGLLTLPATLSYTHTLAREKDNAGLLAASLAPTVTVDQTISVPADGNFKTLGGITADAEHLYIALQDGKDSIVCKLPRKGGSPLYSEPLTGKISSMTLDPVAKTVIALHGDTVSALYTADLTLTGSESVGSGYAAITYLAEKNRYLLKYSGKSGTTLLNGALESGRGSSFALPDVAEGLTLLDMTKDSRYLHLLTPENKLVVADTASARYTTVTLPADSGKAVSVALYGRSLFVGTDGGKLLQCSFEPDAVSTEAQPSDLFGDDFLTNVDGNGWTATEISKIYNLASAAFGNHNGMQGGTTDGRYGYFCFEDQKGNYYAFEKHTTIIAKVDLITWELVGYSKELYLDHCNDMCYNSNTGELMVVHNGSKAKRISFIDRETLTVTGHHDLAINIYSMSYNAITDRYVVGKSGGRNYAVLDGDFNVVVPHLEACPSTAFTTAPKVTTQGIHCDSRYIYAVVCTHDGSKWTNYLTVHDWLGNYVGSKILPGITQECEHIFSIGSVIYIGFSTLRSCPVFRFDITA